MLHADAALMKEIVRGWRIKNTKTARGGRHRLRSLLPGASGANGAASLGARALKKATALAARRRRRRLHGGQRRLRRLLVGQRGQHGALLRLAHRHLAPTGLDVGLKVGIKEATTALRPRSVVQQARRLVNLADGRPGRRPAEKNLRHAILETGIERVIPRVTCCGWGGGRALSAGRK